MPYVGHNVRRSQRCQNTRYNWDNSRKIWVSGQTNTFTVDVLADTVSSSTKRPEPKGWKPPSAYDRTLYFYTPMPGYRQSWAPGGTPVYYDAGVVWTGVFGPLPESVPASVRTAMHFQVLDKVKAQKMDLGTTIAEFPKTARMVGRAATNIANSIRYARRGNFLAAFEAVGLDYRDKFRPVKDVSKNWLALQYGWTPLMLDVESACDVLSTGLGDWRYGATAKRPFPYGFDPSAVGSQIVTRTGERHLKLRLDFQVDNSRAMTFSQLGLTNAAAIAWELVPFSFVADWFVPIGDWLGALHLGMFATFKGGTFTDYINIVDTHVGERSLSSGWLTVGSYGHRRRYIRVKRELISSYLPSIIATPDFSLSLKQMASGLSLLQEVVVRGKR